MTLYERRTVLCKRLFSEMLEPTHKLNALVPPKNLQTYDLRSYSNLLVPRCRTERFSNSFIPAASRAYNNRELKHVGRQHDDDGQNKFLQINDSKENLSYIIIRMNLIEYKKLKTLALCLERVLLKYGLK